MHFIGSGFTHHEEAHLTFRYKFFSRIFCCLGLVLLFTTLVSPFWLIITSPDGYINVGLWNICKKKNCRKLIGSTRILLLTRTLMSFSTVSGFVSVACAFLPNSRLKNSNWPIITNFCTGIMSLITVLLYGLSLNSKGPLGSPYPITTYPVQIAWSFIMACFACFLFLLNGFTLCSLFTLILAIMDHHWLRVTTEKTTYYSSIWKVCIKMVCTGFIASSPNVESARTLLVMALFCGIVGASFMTFTYRYSSGFTIYRYLVAAMGSFITAALIFLALSIFTIRNYSHDISKSSTVTYLWSFYLAWASCPAFIISGLFGLVAHQRLLMHGGASLSDKESLGSTSTYSFSTSTSIS